MSREVVTMQHVQHNDVDYDARKRFSLYVLYSFIVDDRYILVQHVHMWNIIDDELRVWTDDDELYIYDIHSWKKKKKAIKDINKRIKNFVRRRQHKCTKTL